MSELRSSCRQCWPPYQKPPSPTRSNRSRSIPLAKDRDRFDRVGLGGFWYGGQHCRQLERSSDILVECLWNHLAKVDSLLDGGGCRSNTGARVRRRVGLGLSKIFAPTESSNTQVRRYRRWRTCDSPCHCWLCSSSSIAPEQHQIH